VELAVLSFALMCIHTVASARDPVGFSEFVAVTPSRAIDREVNLKGPFDRDVTETFLTGPQFFTHAAGFGEEDAQVPKRT
jgi:hypothetical protein